MKLKVDKSRVIGADGKSTLNKAVKNVKEILETEAAKTKLSLSEPKKVIKKVTKKKWKPLPQREKNRGIVFVGHVPHGFYEEQMKEYCKQFGRVTRVRVSRSRNSGRSRGYAYIEFLDTEVAKIVAQTMNNYLMFGRLLKAAYIPPEKQHEGFFTKVNWTSTHYPKKLKRAKEIRAINGSETADQHKKTVQKSIARLRKLSKDLKEQGIDIKLKVGNKKL